MANDKRNTPAAQGGEMDDLLRMLDSMESHTLGDDIEETIRRYGYGDTPADEYVPPEKGFTPTGDAADLSALLINPDEIEDESGADAVQQVSQLLQSNTEEDMTEDMPPPPESRRNPLAVIGHFFADNWPRQGDEMGTILRKCGFWLSLLVLVAALGYLTYDVIIQPSMNAKLNDELVQMYKPEPIGQETIVTDDTNYPNGMLSSFKELYKRNPEVSGWLSFHSTSGLFDIEYPVMYSGDNQKYARVDFDQKKNKNGCLFLDSRNHITDYDAMDQSTIIYGHNMASGQMFAGLNKLIGNETYARTATTLTFSSLYRQDQYKVFAVCLTDEAMVNSAVYYNFWRTFDVNVYKANEQYAGWTDEEINAQIRKDFYNFVTDVRARSLFDYNSVDVRDDDSILILASCTGRTSANLNDGRVLVFARRVRPGEDAKVDASRIVKNVDVIMPYSWYVNQGERVHEYYEPLVNPVNKTTTKATTTTTTTAETTTTTEATTTTGSTPETTTTTAPVTPPVEDDTTTPPEDDNTVTPPSDEDTTPSEGDDSTTIPEDGTGSEDGGDDSGDDANSGDVGW